MIGYTSFEEPDLVHGNSIPMYVDDDYTRDHELVNYPGQNSVTYSACSTPLRSVPDTARELGFQTFVVYQRASPGLTDGADIVGVIGDVSTEMQDGWAQPAGGSGDTERTRDGHGGSEAPHGNQYYTMDFEDSFTKVRVDPVSVVGFSGVEMVAWVRYIGIDWDRWPDALIVQALDPDYAEGTETVLLGPDHRPHAMHEDPEDKWIEYQTPLAFTRIIVMEFGKSLPHSASLPFLGVLNYQFFAGGSFKGGGAAWFDHFQLRGYGQAKDTSTVCARGGCSEIGTQKGLGEAVCELCGPGRYDDDLSAHSLCVECPTGRKTLPDGTTRDRPDNPADHLECPPCQPQPLPANASAHGRLDFTGGYAHDMDCGWQVACGGGQAALLRFGYFSTEGTHDYVSLSDGGAIVRGGLLSSGEAAPARTFGAQGGLLGVVFHSGASSSTAGGFEAEYWCGEYVEGCTDPIASNFDPLATIDDDSCHTACGTGKPFQPIANSTGVLAFTGSLQDHEQSCSWRFECGGGQAALLHFTTFAVESVHDSVNLVDSGGVDVGGGRLNIDGRWRHHIGGRWLSGEMVSHLMFGSQDGLLMMYFHHTGGSNMGGSFAAEYSCGDYIEGCTDPAASNYDPLATADDGSCITACGPNQDQNQLSAAVASSPGRLNFTGGYMNDMDCSWILNCSGEQAALLRITTFATEATHDYVGLTEGTVSTFNLFQLSAARPVPHMTVGARSGKLLVDFHSGSASSSTAGGFAAQYWCGEYVQGCTDPAAANFNPRATADDSSCIKFCDSNQSWPLLVHANVHGVLDLTGGYANNLNCGYRIECGGGQAALFQFTSFDVFASEGTRDHVRLANDGGVDVGGGLLSGVSVPSVTYGGNGTLVVQLYSGSSSSTAGGFAAEYWCGEFVPGCTDLSAANFDQRATADDGSCITACGLNQPRPLHVPANASAHGVLDFTGGFRNDAECSWHVECDGGVAALLQFSAFTTESGHASVSLADNGGADVTGVGTLSGEEVPTDPFGASGGALVVMFRRTVGESNSRVRAIDGFAAEYWCADAGTVGCIDLNAVNYDPHATINDGSCIFAACVAETSPLVLQGDSNSRRGVLDFTSGYDDDMEVSSQQSNCPNSHCQVSHPIAAAEVVRCDRSASGPSNAVTGE